LTLATLGFNIIYVLLMINLEGLTRGPLGLPGSPHPKSSFLTALAARSITTPHFLLVLFTLGSTYRIIHSRPLLGRPPCDPREETAAESHWSQHGHYKIVSFTLRPFTRDWPEASLPHFIRFNCAGQLHLLGSFTLLACWPWEARETFWVPWPEHPF